MTTLATLVGVFVGLAAACGLIFAGMMIGYAAANHANHARRKPRRRRGSPWAPSDN